MSNGNGSDILLQIVPFLAKVETCCSQIADVANRLDGFMERCGEQSTAIASEVGEIRGSVKSLENVVNQLLAEARAAGMTVNVDAGTTLGDIGGDVGKIQNAGGNITEGSSDG